MGGVGVMLLHTVYIYHFISCLPHCEYPSFAVEHVVVIHLEKLSGQRKVINDSFISWPERMNGLEWKWITHLAGYAGDG